MCPSFPRYNDHMKLLPRLVIGLLGAVLSMGAFFFLMQYFELFNSVIQFRNPVYMSKLFAAQFFLPFSLFCIFGATGGYRAGLIAAAGMTTFLGLGYIQGLLSH